MIDFIFGLLKFVLKIFPRLWREVHPERLMVRHWLIFLMSVLAASLLSVFGTREFSLFSAEQKHIESQTAGEEQQRQIVQSQENLSLQFQHRQDEALRKFLATPTPPDPEDVAKYQASANLWRHFVNAQQESQREDKPPGSDDTVWEHQTYTDSNGIIWQRVTSTDSDGTKQYFVPQMPEQFTR
jgi:hypothetical protein